MNNDILITGSKGFIGNRLKGKTFEGDIRQINLLLDQVENVNGIVHLAAVSGKKRCSEYPYECITTNVLGTLNILDVALLKKIWVLFISTYQIKEHQLYSLSKLLCEELCKLYKEKGLNVRILRLPIVYGENDKSHKVVTKIINEIKSGIEPIADNDEKFYFMYVDDAVKEIENQVDVIQGGHEEKYSITDLITGIKKCLNVDK